MWKRLLLAVPLAVVGAAWFYWLTIPWPVRLRTHDPQATAVMQQRVAEAAARGDELVIRHDWVPLERISPRLRRAVIVAEDGRFHDHDGIDWDALREEFRYGGDDDFSIFDADDRRALLASLRYYRENRDRIRGRSTITQQLAKNLYYSTDRSVVRKLEEFVVARRLERFLGKDRILELYLNVVEWGPGVFGAEAASQHYFSRPAAELSNEQAAALAATLPHPLTSNPRTRPGRMQWRQQLILSRMGGTGAVPTVPLEPATPPGAGAAPLGEDVDARVPATGDTLPDPPAVPPREPEPLPGQPPRPDVPPPVAAPPVPPPDTLPAG
jgi:monofunctional glycosyltransferase